MQGLNLRLLTKVSLPYALLVDAETMDQVTDRHREVIDKFILLPDVSKHQDPDWKIAGEQFVFDLTPFKQTYKLDVDVLLSANWEDNSYSTSDLAFANFTSKTNGELVDNLEKISRKVFVDNKLPNIYTAFYFFRYCQQTHEFFQIVKNLYADWEFYRDHVLINCRHEYPRQDEVFALAWLIYRPDATCFINPFQIRPIIHMRPDIQYLAETVPWYKQLPFELDEFNNLVVGNYKTCGPLHYIDKDFATEVVKTYEQRYRIRFPETNI